jgi:uncharacterized protein YndB with AHSA1/START domain
MAMNCPREVYSAISDAHAGTIAFRMPVPRCGQHFEKPIERVVPNHETVLTWYPKDA